MKNIALILSSFLITLTFSFSLFAQATTATIAITAKFDSGKVEFLAIGKPSFLKIKGTGSGAKGDAQIESGNVTGSFEFPLSTLDTGIKLRNDHMKDKYLEIGKYPNAVLKLSKFAVPADFDVKKSNVQNQKFEGSLQLHGQEKPVAGTASYNAATGALQASFDIKISEFAITLPKYMGIQVSEDVKISVTGLKVKK